MCREEKKKTTEARERLNFLSLFIYSERERQCVSRAGAERK